MDKHISHKTMQLRQYFEQSADRYPDNIALICDNVSLTYMELETCSNQLAHYLISQGITNKHSVGLFLERSLESYVSLLAVLKTGAAYVPIEVEYPDERVNHILSDMPFHSVITSTPQFSRNAIQFPDTIIIDELKDALLQQPATRPELTINDSDQLCYVIYTSGSTGKPKGVEITQSNICHYVAVASTLYEMTPQDNVYQGFSLAFDASLEELWMAFANGASLVACLPKDIRSGLGLVDFLKHHKISFFSTVPTLLATLDGNLPDLRLLILGGEACNANLIKRWCRPGLRIMNTYGPTEATVIATYADCYHDKPVTIGKPLPGYSVVLLDEHLQTVADGQQGELCIGGNGLARAYVNRPDITAQKFITNPADSSQRLYRTGDLAMINSNGDIQFLGRVDDQIKLRGFRIELNEIEEVIMEYPAISQAIVSLQELDSPALVAYLLVDNPSIFDLNEFKNFLHKKIPYYMVPAHFQLIDAFPLLSSGKVNRKALPKLEITRDTENCILPDTKLEQDIANIWQEEFKCQTISVEADFFYDLGGHSLLAAKIVSSLRKIQGLQQLSILDLYNNPTIRSLAKKLETAATYHKFDVEKEKNNTGKLKHWLCGMGQFIGCLLQYAINAWQLLVIVLCYNWIARENASALEIVITCLGLFLGLPIISMLVTIAAKWLLVGRIKPGKYKLWGWFYLRFWLVDRLQSNVFCPKHLIGSPLINLYYRLLGAKIGKNCFIGTASVAVHDSLTIGDNSSIGYDSRLLSYIVEDGWLKIGTITIGENCFIGARTVVSINTIINDNGVLDDMSMLPGYTEIPANQFYCGSPARPSIAPVEHATRQIKNRDTTSSARNFLFGVLHYLCLVFIMIVHYGCFYPAIVLASGFHEQTHFFLTAFIGIPLGAILYLTLHYSCIIACKKLLLNKVEPGIYSIKSLYYLRQWIVVKMLDDDAVFVMADSLFLPHFMRLLGAKLGRHVEMGEAPHVIPDLITILDEGFTASSVAFAWPNIFQGSIRFAPVQVGKRGFLGNVSFLPIGAHIGEGGLLGCLSTTPPNNKAADIHSSWLGSPAVFLPKRELVTGFTDCEKYTPSQRTYNIRLGIESVRIIAPTAFKLFELFSLLAVLDMLLDNYSLLTTSLVLPIAELLIVCGIVGIVVMLKWMILGKLKPATKPIWDIFIRKLDLIEYMFSYYINTNFTNMVLGTPFVSILFRCLGAKIGKQVYIETTQFAEFDLISIADNVCINAETLIDTHLYEDRIFKMSTIDIHEGCNIGIGSIILYDTVMEKNSSLGNLSLLMKGETLPANTSWQGAPAQPIQTGHTQDINMEAKNRTTTDSLIVEIS